jgi:hypothetical protein
MQLAGEPEPFVVVERKDGVPQASPHMVGHAKLMVTLLHDCRPVRMERVWREAR